MGLVKISKLTFSFLEELKQNNEWAWFTQNKPLYLQVSGDIMNFADSLLKELNKHDVIETPSGAKSQYRIYRDVRFSLDKMPYNTYLGGRFKRAGKERRGGYYYHFEPGNKSFLSGDFWRPNAHDLRLIRDDIAFNPKRLTEIINSDTFTEYFGVLRGEQLKNIPRGFEKTHEAADLLRYKQFLVRRKFTDEQVLSSEFLLLASDTIKEMRPFLDYMSEVLSIDANGR
ncbi:DUF2461 domain-containing protein [Mucilaginibacter sabulilitoris]|uniref:DUF2461 domain-containing protein n=1 Tax=Mucilaginibacter sabulilitoris TaxID=1173583 RepID=A0ABZ0TV24_9SPHI|nr:DUF2461 domain-containing protein [Mucilaginibacter sabulilitoris]WPU96932.1 DUF2461 domain-containing protein [Mucilaginibacter sabulilitoris]